MLYFNASSESKGHGNKSEKENAKWDKSNSVSTSSQKLLSCAEDDKVKSSAFVLSGKSQLNKEEQSRVENFSALEANTEICNNVDNKGNDSDDDESYIDDDIEMMVD